MVIILHSIKLYDNLAYDITLFPLFLAIASIAALWVKIILKNVRELNNYVQLINLRIVI